MSAIPVSRDWRHGLLLVFFCIGLLVISYWPTAHSMFGIWHRSETFAHGFLILPISAYLIFLKRNSVGQLSPQPRFLPLVLLALATGIWLIANLAGILVLEQYAFVAMVPLLVWIILGREITKALAFPLLFLFFAVPAGEALNPALMQMTADSVVFMLDAGGIPVQREGLFFSIPTGRWAVVEACSGLRYLIASLALGCLFAYLVYQNWKKRAIFIAAAAVVPLAANCVRAYLIVLIGHASNMKLAVGIDHFIYGWLFFALVIAPLFTVGISFADQASTASASPTHPAIQRVPQKIIAASVAALGVLSTAPVFAAYSQGALKSDPVTLIAPEAENGWEKISRPHLDFAPHYSGARSIVKQSYRKGSDRVELFIAYYRDQRKGAEMVTSQNVVVSSDDRMWRKISEISTSQPFPVNATKVRKESTGVIVWHWYWVDGHYTASSIQAKLFQIQSQLFHAEDHAAAIFISTENDSSALADFARSVDVSGAFSHELQH